MRLLQAATLLIAAAPALANDTSAELATSELIFVQTTMWQCGSMPVVSGDSARAVFPTV